MKVLISLFLCMYFILLTTKEIRGRAPIHIPSSQCSQLGSLPQNTNSRLENYTVSSSVKTRFACTKVFSKIQNTGQDLQELCFTVQIPETAFVSDLRMEINGVKYKGTIEEKEIARQIYDEQKNSKFTVALVESVEGANQEFKVCAAVPSRSSASFTVEYKQLLEMKFGKIEHRIPIEPGRNADILKVLVRYQEPQGISTIHSSHGSTSGSRSSRVVSYTRQRNNCDSNDIVVTYKPNVRNSVTTYVSGNTFVQFFSPRSTFCFNINIVFVVDRSGSMRSNNKIGQVKKFLKHVIGDLRQGDNFNIITFSSSVEQFNSGSLVRAEFFKKYEAINFINNIRASGLTDINGGSVAAVQHIVNAFNSDPNRANLIFLISDGHANVGERNPNQIDKNIRNTKGNVPLAFHSFPVGRYADIKLLKRLTVYNNGELHPITDQTVTQNGLDKEIRRVYNSVECPLLSNIKFNYPDGSVEDVTINSFPYFFNGQELIVSGKILDGSADLIQMSITGNIRTGRTITWRRNINIRLANSQEDSCLNKTLRAYLEVKKKYQEYSELLTFTGQEDYQLKQEIIDASKHYHFVTNLTSLLVTKQSPRDMCGSSEQCTCFSSGCPTTPTVRNQAGNMVKIAPPAIIPFLSKQVHYIISNKFHQVLNVTSNKIKRDAEHEQENQIIDTPISNSIQDRHITKCPLAETEDFSEWFNVSECRDVDSDDDETTSKESSSQSVQMWCKTDLIDKCKQYFIRSHDCKNGFVKYLTHANQEIQQNTECAIWYDVNLDTLRCTTQNEMVQNLLSLRFNLCPIPGELKREHQLRMNRLYEELESEDENRCTYYHELGSCKLT